MPARRSLGIPTAAVTAEPGGLRVRRDGAELAVGGDIATGITSCRNRKPRRPGSRRMRSPGQSAVIHDRPTQQCHGYDAVPGVTDEGAVTAGARDRGGRSTVSPGGTA